MLHRISTQYKLHFPRDERTLEEHSRRRNSWSKREKLSRTVSGISASLKTYHSHVFLPNFKIILYFSSVYFLPWMFECVFFFVMQIPCAASVFLESQVVVNCSSLLIYKLDVGVIMFAWLLLTNVYCSWNTLFLSSCNAFAVIPLIDLMLKKQDTPITMTIKTTTTAAMMIRVVRVSWLKLQVLMSHACRQSWSRKKQSHCSPSSVIPLPQMDMTVVFE